MNFLLTLAPELKMPKSTPKGLPEPTKPSYNAGYRHPWAELMNLIPLELLAAGQSARIIEVVGPPERQTSLARGDHGL